MDQSFWSFIYVQGLVSTEDLLLVLSPVRPEKQTLIPQELGPQLPRGQGQRFQVHRRRWASSGSTRGL